MKPTLPTTEPTVMGVETEYGFAQLGRPPRLRDRETVLEYLMSIAHCKVCCLRDTHSGGCFLSNGARFYVDIGSHPEYATPECQSPWEAVRYVLAGDRMLALLAAETERAHGFNGITLWRSNVDYLTCATWGAHENFLHRRRPSELRDPLTAHLVTRLCYSGAGGFRPGTAGLEFVLSPRVAFITGGIIDEVMPTRAIIHEKREPLAANYYRLHLVCGESLCSELAYVLKLGATALVVAAIDAGAIGQDAIRLCQPATAMWRFARDPTFRITAPLEDGRSMTALDIQRWYFERVAAHLGADWMPSWAPRLCEYWGQTLDALAQGPDAVSTSLDWAIKLVLFSRRLQKHGIDESSLIAYSTAARMRDPGLASAALYLDEFELLDLSDAELETIRNGERFSKHSKSQIQAFLTGRGLSMRGLKGFDKARAEVFEMDALFGQVTGPSPGLFAQLDAAGVLSHRVPEIGDINAAVDEPPPGGRAARRSEYIRKLQGTGASCSWDAIRDREGAVMVDLSDPFGQRVVEHEPPLQRSSRVRARA